MKKYYKTIELPDLANYTDDKGNFCNLTECEILENPIEENLFEGESMAEAIEHFGLTEIKKEIINTEI